MKHVYSLVVGMLLTSISVSAYTTEPIYSYGSNNIVNQLDELPIVRSIGGGTKFIITYEDEKAWTEDMRGAFDYACKIWEEQLPSLPPLRITASIATMRGQGKNAPLSSVQFSIPEIINPRDGVTAYPSTRLKYTVFTELLRGTPIYDQNLISDTLTIKDFDIKITLNQSRLDEIAYTIDNNCGEKYDAVSLFLRDIAKGLGISTSYYEDSRYTGALFQQSTLRTPFEYLIEDKIFFDDPNEAYEDATKGSIPIQVMGYPDVALYAPNPWQQGVSLNTFIPVETSQLSKLLTYDFGKGSVLRNVYDSNLKSFLEYGLRWDYILWTGTGSPSISSSGTTRDVISLDGYISKDGSNYSNYYTYGEGADLLNLQKSGADKNRLKENKEVGYYVGHEYKRYHYLYDPDTQSTEYHGGVTVGILKKDGSWDIVYNGGSLSLMTDIYVKDFQFHEPPENYARTCDGYLRMRVVRLRNNSGTQIACTFYALDYYPQKVEMGTPIECDEEYLPSSRVQRVAQYDDYLRTVRIPIRNLEGIDRIEVRQIDEGNSYPYYYDINDFKKGYFTTIVDCEYRSWITLTAYNHNGSTESETLVVSLSDNAFSNHDVKVSVISDGTYLSFDMPDSQRSSMIYYTLIPLTSIGSEVKLQGSVSADDPKIDISNLPKGYYGISYVCHGVRFTSKFAKL